MSLIIMCCHDTEENGRSEYTRKTMECLAFSVDWSKNRLVIVDNNSCEKTKSLINNWKLPEWNVITLSENVGTAKGINLGIKLRKPNESICKIDNDVVIHHLGWVEEMEEVIKRDSSIGIVGLKRKDLAESPNSEHPFYRSELIMLPHESGQKWIVVEKVKHVMGTCQMLSNALLDKVGYYFQTGLYGLDDSDMSYRSELSGFKNVFLPHINIDHVDTGGDNYTQWKHEHASEQMAKWGEICEQYRNGTRELYYNGL